MRRNQCSTFCFALALFTGCAAQVDSAEQASGRQPQDGKADALFTTSTSTDPATEEFWNTRCPGETGEQQLHFSAVIDAPPSYVFPYLTYEDKIGWLGTFHVRRFGTPLPYGAGSIRVVGLNSAPIVEETVFEYDFADELTYGVTRSATYKNHCGVMRTSALSGDRTLFRWDLRFDPKSGGSGAFLKSFTNTYLGDALKRLENRVERDYRAGR